MSSSWGKALHISLFGESHGEAIGVVLDGLPPGIAYDEAAIALQMQRRAPGGRNASQRREADVPHVLSGIYMGQTNGAPLCAIIANADARPEDYDALLRIPRPGHADYAAHVRYGGHNDARGGGHLSGRLTAPLVFAGAVARLALARWGVSITGRVVGVGGVSIDDEAAMDAAIQAAKNEGDSVGGLIEATADGVPVGWGDPIFGGMESRIAQLAYAVPGIKGVAFGTGFALAGMRGSQANDAFIAKDGAVRTVTNHHGGMLGGITTGMPVIVQAAVKPTPSIAIPQASVDLATMQPADIATHGRHDACIAPRALPALEAALALALLDAALEAEGNR